MLCRIKKKKRIQEKGDIKKKTKQRKKNYDQVVIRSLLNDYRLFNILQN